MSVEQRLKRIEQGLTEAQRRRDEVENDSKTDSDADRFDWTACGAARERLKRAAGLTDRERWIWGLYWQGFWALVDERRWNAFRRLHDDEEMADEQKRKWAHYFAMVAHVQIVEWRETVIPQLTRSREANEVILANAREAQAHRLEEVANAARSEMGQVWGVLSDEDRSLIGAVYRVEADLWTSLECENLGIDNAEAQELLLSATEKIRGAISEAEAGDLRAARLRGVRGLGIFGERLNL